MVLWPRVDFRSPADGRQRTTAGPAGLVGKGKQNQQQSGNGLTDTARDAASKVGEAVGGVGEGAGEVIGRAGDTAQEVGWRLERFMQASPLAMAAIAAGAGAVVGAFVPSTPAEKDMLGDASRQVGERIRDTVGEVADKAESSLDEVEEKVSTR